MTTASAAVAIIPVRVGSRRLPGKALLAESGKPLFLHTWDAARRATRFERVLIATDSNEVRSAAEAAGAEVVMTSEHARTGSERCAEAARGLDEFDFVVDIQGDWPEVAGDDLDALVDCLAAGDAPTATLASPLAAGDPLAADPNVVKVVRGLDGDALYFSRALVPHRQDEAPPPTRLRHIGVYAFTRGTLLAIPQLASSGLAESEGLEQLRFLENGIRMRVLDAANDPWGIETRDDYEAFLGRLAAAATDRPGDDR